MTKVKMSPDDRIYDSDGLWLRSACVCVRDESESEVLLVSSSARPDCWIVPGGKVQVTKMLFLGFCLKCAIIIQCN